MIDKCAQTRYNQRTMAEVAVFISIGSDQAIAGPGKGTPPKETLAGRAVFPGPAQNMRGTVVRWDGALTRDEAYHAALPAMAQG